MRKKIKYILLTFLLIIPLLIYGWCPVGTGSGATTRRAILDSLNNLSPDTLTKTVYVDTLIITSAKLDSIMNSGETSQDTLVDTRFTTTSTIGYMLFDAQSHGFTALYLDNSTGNGDTIFVTAPMTILAKAYYRWWIVKF